EARTVVQVGFLEQLRHIETLIGALPQLSDCKHSVSAVVVGEAAKSATTTKKRKLSNANDENDHQQPLGDLDLNCSAGVAPPLTSSSLSSSSSSSALANIVKAVKQEIIVMAENCGRVGRWLQVQVGTEKTLFKQTALTPKGTHNIVSAPGRSAQTNQKLELSFDNNSEPTRDYYTSLIKDFTAAEDCAFATLGSIQKYYERRADLQTKLLKHPEIDDYAHAVHELDCTEWLHLRAVLEDLALNCTVLHNRASSLC
ncbi:Proteasome activator complex subunit 3, partial [Geranomyces variabilis]